MGHIDRKLEDAKLWLCDAMAAANLNFAYHVQDVVDQMFSSILGDIL